MLLKLARRSLNLSGGVLSGRVRCWVEKVWLQRVCCALTISIVDLLTLEVRYGSGATDGTEGAHKSAAEITREVLESATEVTEGRGY